MTEELKIVAWSYEFHDFAEVWGRGIVLNRPDGGANPPTKHYGSDVRDVQALCRHDEAMAEIDGLTKERDAAFAMSRCECGTDEACANLVAKDGEIERLQAENATLRQQLAETRGKALDEIGWQPIETAPKNGTPILASTDEYDEPLILRWKEYNGLSTWRDWDMDPYRRVTHWFPIPDPPSIRALKDDAP